MTPAQHQQMTVPQILNDLLDRVQLSTPITLGDATELRAHILEELRARRLDASVECYHNHRDLMVQVWYGENRSRKFSRAINPQ
jgi:hypothetical protein